MRSQGKGLSAVLAAFLSASFKSSASINLDAARASLKKMISRKWALL
jgi:hypothetical protein